MKNCVSRKYPFMKDHLSITKEKLKNKAGYLFLLLGMSLILPTAQVQAQTPANVSQPTLTFVVGYAPGGTTDIIARIVAKELTLQTGQTVIVENKAGANSNIGAEYVANGPTNGTRFYIGSTANAINKSLYKKLNYDIEKDLTAVALLGSVPNMLVINPALPIQNVEQYIAYARANPGKLTCASSGAGSAIHMSCELFKIQTNTNILHVPYKGSSLALNDLLGGQVSSIFDNMPSVLQQVRAGKLRALGVTTATRSSFAPDIPTLAESGLPDFSVQAWFGLFAPSATEPSLLKQMNANVTRALATEATKTSYTSAGIAIPSTPNTVDTFTAFVRQEVQKWATVVRQSGTETQ
jgi:tripartite-type tricarboxylate transporter receptor subunit TctC